MDYLEREIETLNVKGGKIFKCRLCGIDEQQRWVLRNHIRHDHLDCLRDPANISPRLVSYTLGFTSPEAKLEQKKVPQVDRKCSSLQLFFGQSDLNKPEPISHPTATKKVNLPLPVLPLTTNSSPPLSLTRKTENLRSLDKVIVSSKSRSTFRKRKPLDSDPILMDTVVTVKKEMHAQSAVCKERSQRRRANKPSIQIRKKMNRKAVVSVCGADVVPVKRKFVEEENDSDGSTIVLSEETYFDLTVSDFMNPVILTRLLKQSSLENLLKARSTLVEADALILYHSFLFYRHRQPKEPTTSGSALNLELKKSRINLILERINCGLISGKVPFTPVKVSLTSARQPVMVEWDPSPGDLSFLMQCSYASGISMDLLMGQLTRKHCDEVERDIVHILRAEKLLMNALSDSPGKQSATGLEDFQ